jgi:hypothetical protein
MGGWLAGWLADYLARLQSKSGIQTRLQYYTSGTQAEKFLTLSTLTYIHTQIYIYIHTYIHIDIHAYIHTYIHT